MAENYFKTYATKFINSMAGTYADSTWVTFRRRLNRMAKDVEYLYSKKEISSMSPQKWDVEDMRKLLVYHKTQGNGGMGVSGAEMSHEIGAWETFLETIDKTSILTECKRKYPILNPHNYRARLPSLSVPEYEKILEVFNSTNMNDYHSARAVMLVGMAIFMGLRSKEMQFSEVSHLKMVGEDWEIFVAHPKGEKTYAQGGRNVIIPEIFKPFIKDYLKVRAEWLFEQGIRSQLIFPNPKTGKPLASNTLRKIKRSIEEKVGFQFNLRDCRRTFGQKHLDVDVSIESVSVLMGHSTTRTTEGYYCRRPEKNAKDEVRNNPKSIW